MDEAWACVSVCSCLGAEGASAAEWASKRPRDVASCGESNRRLSRASAIGAMNRVWAFEFLTLGQACDRGGRGSLQVPAVR